MFAYGNEPIKNTLIAHHILRKYVGHIGRVIVDYKTFYCISYHYYYIGNIAKEIAVRDHVEMFKYFISNTTSVSEAITDEI